MKPYYEHAGITIYHGDCREILPQLPKGWCSTCACELGDEQILAIHLVAKHEVGPRFDLTLTDPPYGVGFAEWDDEVPPLDWLKLCRAISTCVVFTPGVANMAVYPQPDWTMCWFRPASVQRSRIGGFNNWEPLFVYGKVVVDNDTISLCHTGREIEGHPCPKPEELMARLISKTDASSVLDPFFGSGTTLAAAKNLRKSAIGIEIHEPYCELAAKRLSQEVLAFGEASHEQPRCQAGTSNIQSSETRGVEEKRLYDSLL